jgi:hypothetical protein
MVLSALAYEGSFRAKLLKNKHLFVTCVSIKLSPGRGLEVQRQPQNKNPAKDFSSQGTVAEIYKAFWAFLGIASPDCSGFKNQWHFFGVARSTYVGSPFRNTSRVGGGVEIKKNCHFRSN